MGDVAAPVRLGPDGRPRSGSTHVIVHPDGEIGLGSRQYRGTTHKIGIAPRRIPQRVGRASAQSLYVNNQETLCGALRPYYGWSLTEGKKNSRGI